MLKIINYVGQSILHTEYVPHTRKLVLVKIDELMDELVT